MENTAETVKTDPLRAPDQDGSVRVHSGVIAAVARLATPHGLPSERLHVRLVGLVWLLVRSRDRRQNGLIELACRPRSAA